MNPYNGFAVYWQGGKAMGKFTMRLPHVICKPDSQHLKGCRICWLSLFLFSFHRITVSVLLCHFSWGFLTESGKAMHPLGVQSRILVTLGRRCTGRTGEAELMCHFWGKTCCTKIAYKTHRWERDADKNFSTPVSVIFNFKTFCERCCNSVNKYKTIWEWCRCFVHQLEK